MVAAAVTFLLMLAGGSMTSPAPTPAPVSDDSTVIWCGAVLGESASVTQQRLGAPDAEAPAEGYSKDQRNWYYQVDSGRATCKLRVREGRVVEIAADLNARDDSANVIDPFGITLGDSSVNLVKARGHQIAEVEEQAVYASASGACWSYGFRPQDGASHVDEIRVFLNLNNPDLDCHPNAH